jgi:hypothetical protein
MQKQLIRVVYPTDGGRIALRTEENWNSNIEAHSVAQNGSLSEFWIRTERPYFYFKPVLVSDSICSRRLFTKSLRQTLREAHIPFPELNAVFVSTVEFVFGLLLVAGGRRRSLASCWAA